MVVGLTGCPSGSTSETSVADGGRDAQGADTGSPPGDAGSGNDAAVTPTPPPDFLWYVLDETQGTTATDSSPNHYDITNLTGVTWSDGANFDGMSGGGSTMVATSVRTPPISITAWLKPAARADSTSHEGYALVPFPANALSDDIPSIGGYAIGLNVWTDGTPGSALSVEGVDTCKQSGLCVCNSSQNAADVDGGPSCTSATDCNQGFVAGVEHFVAVAIGPASGSPEMGAAQVYVDGVLFDESTAGVAPMTGAAPLYLGVCNDDISGYGTRAVFDGRIRDVRIYGRALGAAEVAQLFANGPTLHAPSPPDGGAGDAGSE